VEREERQLFSCSSWIFDIDICEVCGVFVLFDEVWMVKKPETDCLDGNSLHRSRE